MGLELMQATVCLRSAPASERAAAQPNSLTLQPARLIQVTPRVPDSVLPSAGFRGPIHFLPSARQCFTGRFNFPVQGFVAGPIFCLVQGFVDQFIFCRAQGFVGRHHFLLSAGFVG